MNDFAKLTGQPPAIDESLEAFELKPEGYENGMGEPLCLTMHPASGTRFKRAARKVHLKMTRADGSKADEDDDMTEEELDAAIDTQDDRSAELLARCCAGWNMTDGTKPMKHNLENVCGLFGAVESLRLVVDKAITARGKPKKAKKSA